MLPPHGPLSTKLMGARTVSRVSIVLPQFSLDQRAQGQTMVPLLFILLCTNGQSKSSTEPVSLLSTQRNSDGSWDADINWPQGVAKHWDSSSLKTNLRMLGFSAPSFHWQVAKLGFPYQSRVNVIADLQSPWRVQAFCLPVRAILWLFQGRASCSFPMV